MAAEVVQAGVSVVEGTGVYSGMRRLVHRFMVGFGIGFLLTLVMVIARGQSTEAVADVSTLTVGNKLYDTNKELARLTKRYGLNEEQKAQIRPILLEQQRKIHELGEDQSLTGGRWAAEVWKVHLQTVAEVKRRLTDAQVSKYAKDEAKRKVADGGSEDDFGPPGGPPPGLPPGGGPPM
jgi:hypothetical protein